MGIRTSDFSKYGLLRVAAASPRLSLAHVELNAERMLEQWHDSSAAGAALTVFPELSLTGYTCGDLFLQSVLREAALKALVSLAEESAQLRGAALVGLPLEIDQRLFNVAALVSNGQIHGFLPKRHLPNYGEFYEQRWFASARDLPRDSIRLNGVDIPVGANLIFRADTVPGLALGVEICEDLWAPKPPSTDLALGGACVLANLSASDELLGKAAYRRDLVRQQSARCLAGYIYAGSGPCESSTDVVYGGHNLIAENGTTLAESARFDFEGQLTFADLDLEFLAHERMKNTTFTGSGLETACVEVGFELPLPDSLQPPELRRPLPKMPFVPSDETRRAEHCEEIFAIQTTGLARRLNHTGSKAAVIGVSGGLDSTLALLVSVRAFEKLGLDLKGLQAITMPGFGTSERTLENARNLIQQLGLELRMIPIDAAVRQHFADIGHDESDHSVVYENAQARERTQILMDVANQVGGFVVGTGDLSESALGWATYNADHMSMYHVNIGVPKTLVRYLVDWSAEAVFNEGPVRHILSDIAQTPITPELLPLGEQGEVLQKTEDSLGPYRVHDFFLYHMVRRGCAPSKLLFLAAQAFGDEFSKADLRRWLEVFLRRFFAQQYKRSCMPDGPKVGTVALSPRGDWRMPSDASAESWLRELSDA
ncbi:MAG: NAD(+) synthase [Opitutales bacterium]